MRIDGELVHANASAVRAGTAIMLLVPDAAAFPSPAVVVEDGYALGPAHERAYALIDIAAQAGETALILGETGTGNDRSGMNQLIPRTSVLQTCSCIGSPRPRGAAVDSSLYVAKVDSEHSGREPRPHRSE